MPLSLAEDIILYWNALTLLDRNVLRVLCSAGLLFPKPKVKHAHRNWLGTRTGCLCNAAFLALGSDGPCSTPAHMAAVLPLAGSFSKSLEKFQYRPEINTDSDQARPVTAYFIGCRNEDQFVLITLELVTNSCISAEGACLSFPPRACFICTPYLRKRRLIFSGNPIPLLPETHESFVFIAMPSPTVTSQGWVSVFTVQHISWIFYKPTIKTHQGL